MDLEDRIDQLANSSPRSERKSSLNNDQQVSKSTTENHSNQKILEKTNVRVQKHPSCNACRKSKTKCDRKEPCSHCAKTGTECIYPVPSRLPRGRKGGRPRLDNSLRDRIAKLEKLVKAIEGESMEKSSSSIACAAIHTPPQHIKDENVDQQQTQNGIHLNQTQQGLDRYVGGTVWMTLSDEIQGIRDILDQPSSDEDDDANEMASPTSSSKSTTQSGFSNFVVRSPQSIESSRSLIESWNIQQLHYIYTAYMQNVDSANKILHSPSLYKFLVEGTGTLDCSPGTTGLDALKLAICYTAITSISPEQCLQQFGENHGDLILRLRSTTEHELAKADFVVNSDISIIQALLLYLFAMRSNENSSRTWTLTGLIVRKAQALGLHREKRGDKSVWNVSIFEREMQRRLWWMICLLDRQGTLDRGSEPVISPASFTTELPLNINDSDINPETLVEPSIRTGFTDLTFQLMTHEVYDVERRLNCHIINTGSTESDRTDPWTERRNWVVDCQKRVYTKYLQHCDVNIPLQRYTKVVSEIIMSLLWLWAYRPMNQNPGSLPAVNLPYQGILKLSVDVLENASKMIDNPTLAGFQWASRAWVQWHAFAVMLAELCVHTEGPLVERGWTVFNTIYDLIIRNVADSDKGRLWKPIKKLMAKAQAVRERYLENTLNMPMNPAVEPAMPFIPTESILSPSNMNIPMMNTNVDFQASALPPQPLDQTIDMTDIGQIFTGVNPMSSGTRWEMWMNPMDATTVPVTQADPSNEMAWNGWETFVDDLQGYGNIFG